ncbi:MAG: hypothetical protein KA369_21605 [Spirochaetes bacterium]|nr:hypothetical protein [Spirochaetota bacterium]
MNIIVFEDGLHDNFYPLSLTKPLWELRSGLYSFRERLELFIRKDPKLSNAGLYFFTREYLAPFFRERYPHLSINDYSVFDGNGECFFLNAVAYPSASDFALEVNSVVMMGPVPVAARIGAESMRKPEDSIPAMLANPGLSVIEYDGYPAGTGKGRKAEYIWDLMDSNPWALGNDYALAGFAGNGYLRKDVTISGDATQVYIEEEAAFEPFVFIEASEGPVFIGAGARINSFSRIEGPCMIGRECVIYGAKIRSGSSIGPFCRIGGEIEQSIFHGYSNKYHDGFIGHSYIGEWINMGALTTNSDLKNNYTNVKVYTSASRRKTGRTKIGCFMGDFVKTSIGTLINTGSSIGPGAMLVHAGKLTPCHIPSFSWYIDGETGRPLLFDDFMAVCRRAMARRNVEVSEEFSALMRTVYDMTSPERTQP